MTKKPIDIPSVTIRSYNHSTDEKAVKQLFINGLKSTVPQNLFQVMKVYLRDSVPCCLMIAVLVISVHIIAYLLHPYLSPFSFGFKVLWLESLLSHLNVVSHSLPSFLAFPIDLLLNIYSDLFTLLVSLHLVGIIFVIFLEFMGKKMEQSVDGYIRHSLASDLANIEEHYMKKGPFRHMWVATLNNEIVGTIAMEQKKENPNKVELRRMSVSQKVQRMGIATKLLNCLEKYCEEQKVFDAIELSTSSLNTSAIVFYKKHGFQLLYTERVSFVEAFYILFFSRPINSTN